LANGGSIQPAERTGVLLNAYKLDLSNVVEFVHKYELRFLATNKRGEVKDLSRGAKNEYKNARLIKI
jgi:hypothetical protein